MRTKSSSLKLPSDNNKLSKGEQDAVTTVMSVFLFPIYVWFVMLAFGFVHDVFEVVPAIGFWDSALLSLAVWFLKIPAALLRVFKESLEK